MTSNLLAIFNLQGTLKGWPLRVVYLISILLISSVGLMLLLGFTAFPKYSLPIFPELTQQIKDLGVNPLVITGYGIVLEIITVLAFSLVGSLLMWNKPHDKLTLFAALTLIMFIPSFSTVYWEASNIYPQLDGLAHFMITLGLMLFLTFIYLFPDGCFSPTWSIWFWGGSLPGLISAIYIFSPSEETANPALFFTIIFVVYSIGFVFQKYRWAVSTPLQRQQTKLVLSGLMLGFGGFVFANIPSIFFPQIINTPSRMVVYILYYFTVYNSALQLMSIAFAVSMLKYRLWDIDALFNRTLVYAIVTILLGLGYAANVLLFGELLRLITGHDSKMAIALATLLITILFNPIRNQMQNFIDRQLYRRKYRAMQLLNEFSQTLQNEVDLDKLTIAVVELVNQMLLPAQVSLWLVAEKNGKIAPTDPLVTYFKNGAKTTELAHIALDSSALTALKNLGLTTIVPLVSQAELIGVINLAPANHEQNYSTEERRLLNELATKVAPSIRVAQLVRQQKKEAQVRERLNQEMRVAQQTQQTFLPKTPPVLAGWQMAAYYQPARAVGGDFYDFIFLPNGYIGLAIGDVTDKGVPAAMVMAATRMLLSAIAPQKSSPSETLAAVNSLLCPSIPKKMFVTCFYAILDPRTGQLRYTNAGHDSPYVQRNGSLIELEAVGMPLGLFPEASYQTLEITLLPGDMLLFYSDGLVEAHNSQREMFGFPRVEALLKQQKSNLIELLLTEQAKFTGEDWEQEDDITLVTVQRQK